MCKHNTKKPTSGQILTATLNLESLKTSAQKSTELAEWARLVDNNLIPEPTAEKAALLRERGRQQIAHELLVELAHYLKQKRMTHYYIYTGYRASTPADSWEVYVAFGKEGLTDADRIEVRREIEEDFFAPAPLDDDIVVKRAVDACAGVELHWGVQQQWCNMTRLVVWKDRAFLVEHNGERDSEVLAQLDSAVAGCPNAIQQILMGFRPGMIQLSKLESRKGQMGVSLEQALGGLQLPSARELLEQTLGAGGQNPLLLSTLRYCPPDEIALEIGHGTSRLPFRLLAYVFSSVLWVSSAA
ncbi:uncharacterized protein DSM5745_09823 [Aspergillus mulundensis]|uniref:Uncharacterized protein n=1 Tax=Aspergillus mulundensis TaxID=1810919 RepID=A0A3D8QRJ2_9EURO|nr:hypothetical protein DSM5745_09823 [Aspergillus mulundensis]RDW64412.1 hypothetical protein DSM5745_09823 [Aspergillus mulundensis]